jgi:dTDP-glucose 4,6-dehydratase
VPAASNPALAQQGIASYDRLKTFVQDHHGHDRRYAIDATKIRRDLGWTLKHTFDQGLAKTVRWYLDHRHWCDAVLAGSMSDNDSA